MNVQNISFGARYVKSATIKKKENDELKNHKIAMVELDPYDFNDIKCINNLNLDWGGRASLSYAYALNMNNIFAEITEKSSAHFYALTQQKENFEKLDPELILSLAETSNYYDDKTKSLDLLETFFAESHTSKNAQFKHIGKAMLDNIKFLLRGNDIIAEVVENAEKFYEKEGFERISGGVNRYIFRSIKF